jgi:hypothetical protein
MTAPNRGEGLKSRSPGSDVREYGAPISGPIDLIADGPFPTVDDEEGQPARMFLFTGDAGTTVTVVTAKGETRVLSVDLWGGNPIVCGVREITTAHASVSVGVFW